MTLKKGKKNILIVGRGDSPSAGTRQIFNGDEIECCNAVLEAGNYPVLMTNVSTERVVNALLDIPIFPVPFSKTNFDVILRKEEIDAVYAPFVNSRGWEVVQKLERNGYWDKHQVRILNPYIPCRHEYDRFRALEKSISKVGLKQLDFNEVATEDEARQALQALGGLPVLVRTERGETTKVTSLRKFNLRLSSHFENRRSGKLYLSGYLPNWKEVTVGVISDGNASSIAYTSENVKNNGIFSSNPITVSPIQSLWKNNRESLYKAALSLVDDFEDFAGYCSIRFALDPDKDNILITDVSFSTDNLAAISLGMEASLANILVKLAMGYSLDETELLSETEREEKSRVLLCIPEDDSIRITSDEEPTLSKRETVYVGHNFCEALLKLWHDREIKFTVRNMDQKDIGIHLSDPYWDHMYNIYLAIKTGVGIKEIREITKIDPWFLEHIKLIADLERQLFQQSLFTIPKLQWKNLKNCGFSDTNIAGILSLKNPGITEIDVLRRREKFGIKPPISIFSYTSARPVKRDKTIMILASADNGPGHFSKKISSLLLANEARHLGCKVVLITSDAAVLPFWMSYAEHIYIEPLNWDIIHEVYLQEKPAGIFIESNFSGHSNFKNRFLELKVPIAHIPDTLHFPGSSRNGRDI